MARDFTLPPGGYQAKVVVRDLNSGRVGSVVHEFEVPEAGSLRVSSPVLSDTVETGDGRHAAARPAGAPEPSPRDSVLYCQFSVYGASRDEKGSLMPRVTAGLRDPPGGRERLQAQPPDRRSTRPPWGPSCGSTASRSSGAAPGEYDLVLTIRDELAGKTIEVEEPFAVEAG